MNQKDVIEFFDRMAPQWDGDMVRHDHIIAKILDGAGVRPGKRVLDVACGTGVLFPDYFDRGITDLTAIDIAPEMARIAREKFPQAKVLCGDVETAVLPGPFDCIMIYNAFPHFPEPERLIRCLAEKLEPGGTLTIAHGMSRAAIDYHHEGHASRVSVGLMHENALAGMMRKYLDVTVKISDDHMYQVTGTKK